MTADSATGANFNRYKYAANNPYRFTDPDGRLDREHKVRDWRSITARSPVAAAQMATSARSDSASSMGRESSSGTQSRAGNQQSQPSEPEDFSTQNRSQNTYLDRALERYKSTRGEIPALITFPGTTLLTAGITAKSLDGVTALQAYKLIKADPLSRGPNLIRFGMTSAINFAAISTLWEAGLLVGSMIYEMPVQYGSDMTMGENLSRSIERFDGD